MRKIEIKLAKKNGTLKQVRRDKIIKEVKTQYPKVDDEIAILRKFLFTLAEKVKEQHPEMDLTELEQYYAFVESSKQSIDKELEI